MPATLARAEQRAGQQTGASIKDSVSTVVEGIEELIDKGRLVPGQRLLEPDLIARFQVSRSAVREALRFLAGDGVVELVQNRGGRVTRIDRKRLGDMLVVFSAIFRAAIESVVAESINAAGRKALDQALARVVNTARHGSGLDRLQATFNYHYVIAGLCGNSFFREALDRLHIRHFMRQEGLDEFIVDQVDIEKIYAAMHADILAGQADSAFRILKPELDRLAAHLQR